MSGNLFICVLFLAIASCLCQEEYPRPTFPDVFQTEIEGTFIEENGVVEIDASMFYDRTNNRAALFVTKEADLTRLVLNFDSDESLSIDDNGCEVQRIPEEEGFFPFTVINNKKYLSSAEKAFYFTESERVKESSMEGSIPTIVYKATISIPQYGQSNCDVTHIFSKPEFELPTCKEGLYCNSTLITISVRCKNEEGNVDVDHVYRFSRFKYEIEDESVFLPPPGVHCKLNTTKEFPPFPSYFSFTFDVIEKPNDGDNDAAVFNMHREVWYDAEYQVIRIDEYGYSGLLYSSRIFDINDQAAFNIIASVATCDTRSIAKDIKLDEITGLPKSFFYKSNSDTDRAVYVGKRKVHGLHYQVWSRMWSDSESEARIVEEFYFLKIQPNEDFSLGGSKRKPYLQISHVNTYTYEMNDISSEYELTLLKYYSINNYRVKPKELAAFDVDSCFSNNYKKIFSMKVKGPSLVKESQSYREVLELLYNKIIAVTGVSVLRISELKGIFDGAQLLEVRGSIIDNSIPSGWPTKTGEPGMDETFNLIKKAASENKLTVTFVGGDDDKEQKLSVISVDAVEISSEVYPRPTFPDVFQAEIKGTFINKNRIDEIDASMFYDRINNRAALFVTKDDDLTRLVYNFDNDENLSIDANNCEVQEIPEIQGFFPFTVVNGKKYLSSAEKVFYFTESEENKQSLMESDIPILIYKATISIPQYGQSNCDVTHMFSKPDFELPSCKEGLHCNSTLISIKVRCKNEDGEIVVDHVYRFSRFKYKITDESVFLPPPGVYCNLTNTKEIPPFPSYFSFTFDTIEKPKKGGNDDTAFNTYKEVWYDAEYKIIRIDEFDHNDLLFSSKIFDLKAEVSFTTLTTTPTCDISPFTKNIKLEEITGLPKSFFYQNISDIEKAVHVGKRKVHGLDYQVWSRMWSDTESKARIVEEVYFLQIVPNKERSVDAAAEKPYFQISYANTYKYEISNISSEYELTLLKYFSINNYRTKPKELAAFDVNTCFKNKQKKVFSMKVKGPPLVKGSQSYREVLELLYNKIIAATGVSVVRISQLGGIFDGVELLEIRGSIIDNSKSSGWPKDSKEPGMEETFNLIKKAALENKLSVTFIGENNKKNKLSVTSVEAVAVHSASENKCFSGASMAAASLVLLLIGVSFGVAGYYVFLKKRRPLGSMPVRMSEIDS